MCVLYWILLITPVSGNSSNDLEQILEGVKYHDQLIRTFHVAYTSKDLLRGKNGNANRIRHREGECIFSDGMIVATEVIPPEPLEDDPETLSTKVIRKQIYDKERFMEVDFYQPDDASDSWKEVFFFPKSQFRYLFLHRYSPLFSTTIELMSLSEFAKHSSVVSVHSKGYETVDGDLCFRILFKQPGKDTDVLINLDRGYRMQEVQTIIEEGRYTNQEGHSMGSFRKIEWAQYKDQIWYPTKTYIESYLINNSTKAKIIRFWEEIEFKHFEANIDVAEDTFLTIPPPDASLIEP